MKWQQLKVISVIIFCSDENDYEFQAAGETSRNHQENNLFVPNN